MTNVIDKLRKVCHTEHDRNLNEGESKMAEITKARVYRYCDGQYHNHRGPTGEGELDSASLIAALLHALGAADEPKAESVAALVREWIAYTSPTQDVLY